MHDFRRRLTCSAAVSVAVLALVPAPAAAEEAAAGEEIVVTATQRSTAIQDAPLAVSVVRGQLFRDSGAADLQDLQGLVPSLQFNVSENETSATARLRGVGTQGSGAGLESSVGVIIDGVFRVRNGVALGDLGEVAQIEVLRGPQGTLFGRNTSAGLISVRTAAPDLTRLGGAAEASYGNFDGYRVAGHINAPLLQDRLGLRVFAATADRDGLITVNPDSPLQRADNDRDFWSIRPQLLFEPTPDLALRVIGDVTRRDERCCAGAIINSGLLNGNLFQAPPTSPNGPLGAPIAFGAGAQALFASLGAYGPQGLASLGDGDIGNRRAFADRPYGQIIDEYGVSGEVVWSVAGLTVTSISAYRDWNFQRIQDSDFTQLDILFRSEDGLDSTEFRNVSQEMRVAGAHGPLDWLAGVFYARETLLRRNRLLLGADFGRAFAALSPRFGALRQLAPLPGLDGAVGGGDDSYRQEGRSIAGFSHVIWSATQRLDLTFGLRFTHETKDLAADFTTLTGDQALRLFQDAAEAFAQTQAGGGLDPAQAAAFAAGVTCDPTQDIGGLNGLRSGFCLPELRAELDALGVEQRREENELTGVLSAAFAMTPRQSLYASYSRGYKAGGFNLDRDFSFVASGETPNPQFAEETVDAFELGLKQTLLGGDLLLNAAGYYNLFEDFQLNTYNGFQFVVSSVPKVIARGLELDYFWSTPLRGLSVQGGVALTDARYGEDRDFILDNANPVNGQLTLFRLPGERLTNAPLWSVSHAMTYRRPLLNERLEGLAHLDLRYVSSQFTGSDLDPASLQPGYVTVNARIGVSTLQDRIGLEIWARNLFDADFTQIGFNVPLQGGARGAFLGDPRTFGVTLRARY